MHRSVSNNSHSGSESFVALPMPEVEDLADADGCETESLHSDRSSISRPTRAFFLGCRQSQILDVDSFRAQEEGRAATQASNASNDTLIQRSGNAGADETKQETDNSQPPSLRPRHPLHRTGSLPLPPKKGSRSYRYLRWNFGSVYRRIFTLAFICNLAVLAILLIHTMVNGPRLTYSHASTAVSANVFAAMLIRNEHVVNALFIVFGTWPRNLPLRLRRLFAKVYSYGGIHSGCGVAATVWYVVFVVLLTLDYQRRNGAHELSALRGYVYLVTYAVLFMLVMILVFAHPKLRIAMHNWFEGIHRFLGWSVVLLFWVQTLLIAFDDASTTGLSYGQALLASPSFWLLILITLLVIYPWTRLRLRDVEAEPLSSHCIKLNFNFANGHYGQAIRLSDAPLKETHAFAVIPNPPAAAGPFLTGSSSTSPSCSAASSAPSSPPMTSSSGPGYPFGGYPSAASSSEALNDIESIKAAARAKALARQHHRQQLAELSAPGLSNAGKTGFSVVISDAGDWTRKVIANPPTKMYTRGVPQYGVLRVAGMFEPVIVMATGSGIAPCLALFAEKPDHPVRVIWSAPSPLETFGQGVIDTVLRADPEAIIHDTRKQGRPDLVKMAYRMWDASGREEGLREFALPAADRRRRRRPLGQCEAVVIISNQKVTRKVVYGLESRGVPAYGAIFDS